MLHLAKRGFEQQGVSGTVHEMGFRLLCHIVPSLSYDEGAWCILLKGKCATVHVFLLHFSSLTYQSAFTLPATLSYGVIIYLVSG